MKIRSRGPLRGRPAAWLGLSLLLAGRIFASDLILFETPRDKDVPVLTAIRAAGKEVDVIVYELYDSDVERALIEAHQAGRSVRVLLNGHFASGRNPNEAAFAVLKAAGVDVRYSAPYFTYTHEKAIIVDAGESAQEALIMTLNLGPGYLGKPDKLGLSLNFGVVDRVPAEIALIKEIFEDDWVQTPFASAGLPADTRLVVSPINARARLVGQIRQATVSFHFFAQELEDPEIVAALAAAAGRGVEVRGLIAPNFSFNRPSADKVKAAGGEIRFMDKPIYEHAKAAIADRRIVYIGSINYTTNSMEHNRELGIVTTQADIAARMEAEFAKFWAQGQP